MNSSSRISSLGNPGSRSTQLQSWRIFVALLTMSSVHLATLPCHAFPDARVNLIRISSEGINTLPALDQARLQVSVPTPSLDPLISQAQQPAAPSQFPVLPVVIGVGAAALIVCAIAGCFSGNGNGGTNTSSN
jgi:hypothetical protein